MRRSAVTEESTYQGTMDQLGLGRSGYIPPAQSQTPTTRQKASAPKPTTGPRESRSRTEESISSADGNEEDDTPVAWRAAGGRRSRGVPTEATGHLPFWYSDIVAHEAARRGQDLEAEAEKGVFWKMGWGK
ncbi:hypothetical protein LTS18_009022 [Coniosporium uncinatum]|uniref:Uncharacterized protein n=1 Tax=Coniosporium uncinatum TaxID=93489 RepID=A0ACC3DX97_9PEZI|nr:hypothetical protein LTS18_009022 [Coniosporium uncinatum]